MRTILISSLLLLLVSLPACDHPGDRAENTIELSSFAVDDRTFTLEDEPEGDAETTVAWDFSLTIAADFDKKREILAGIDSHEISIENEKNNFAEGVYIKSYTLHEMDSLAEKDYADPSGPLYYHGLEDLVEQYSLVEYHIVRVHFTQVLSDKANQWGPQWGDGTYARSFLVGKSPQDAACKIYDYGMM